MVLVIRYLHIKRLRVRLGKRRKYPLSDSANDLNTLLNQPIDSTGPAPFTRFVHLANGPGPAHIPDGLCQQDRCRVYGTAHLLDNS